MLIKIALPKGRLQAETATLLEKAGWGLDDYNGKARRYRLGSRSFPALTAKVLQERDIPIQVAIGNYDLGICGADWVEELLAKYPQSAVVRLKTLGYGYGTLYAAASAGCSIEALKSRLTSVRIASEYPNLAELLALRLRLRRFSVFPVWGAVEAYPPESADLAIIPGRAAQDFNHGLSPVAPLLEFSTVLVANRTSWETKDMSGILASLSPHIPVEPEKKGVIWEQSPVGVMSRPESSTDTVWLALPDGHQQPPVSRLLARAGIRLDDYPSSCGNRRPAIDIPGVMVKVIRPQDMPLQVANGNFDLAISGRDWLREHLNQFPSSPVIELADLRLGRVRIVAVVSQDLPVADSRTLRDFCSRAGQPVRIASEYVNIADRFARENHLGRCRIIPTWGATEAFLPDDADILIENTETGQTIARNNLKIIDTLFESTACLIGRTSPEPAKRDKISLIRERLEKAAGEIA